MAISLTNLSPAKNDFNVPVISDISFTLDSDSADIDITTVKFYINGVGVQVSAYYGVDNTEVNANFFSRRLVKYDTGKRYGQDDFRYGQRDIYPSIFQYGYRYTCTVEAQDVDGNTISENFSFTIEEGIFYPDSPPTSFYYPQTQATANYTPEWAKSRYDKFSNFQQLINPSMKYMQELNDSLFTQSTDYFVQTANLNELGTLYRVALGDDFSFETTVLDDGQTLQIPPDLKAIREVTKYEPQAEFLNDLKSFYFNKLPSRLDETKQTIDTLEIYPETDIDMLVHNVDKKLERDGRVVILISGATNLTRIVNNVPRFVTLRITGVSRERKSQTEDITIVDNESYQTLKYWSEIETVQFIGLPETFTGKFYIDHSIVNDAYISDVFNHITIDDFNKSVFWKKLETTHGSVLQKWVYLGDDSSSFITTLGQKDLLSEEEFTDIDGQTNVSLDYIATDGYSKYIYGVDSEYMYIYDKREEYSDKVKSLTKTGSPLFTIDLEADELSRGDTVKSINFQCAQNDPEYEISQYRVSVERPDDTTTYLLENGATTTNKLEADIAIVTTEPQYISPNFSYDLDIVGDYVIRVESIFKNGITSEDAKLARVKKKTALAKYKLERLLGDATISRFFVDFDNRLKILDSNGELHTIREARDNMLVDYDNAIIYFSEEYDEVEV